MADFLESMSAGITAAQATFGATFILAGDILHPYKGMFIEVDAGDQVELGVFSDDIDASMDCGLAQFTTLGVMPKEGDSVRLEDGRIFRVVRINKDEVSAELLMKREAH